jgi:hypothetical protein
MVRLRSRVSHTCSMAVIAGAAVAGLVAASTAQPTSARSARDGKREEAVYLRPGSVPVMAVVSINQQRVTVYDADGAMLRSPVSTGKPGYETPPGIFSVLQKKVEHYSNVYLDAAMPYMQRITWSGIALHAGVLPGYPASGGCIRLPTGFAERLYERTKLGMRVLVVRDDISPADIVHPALFKPLLGDVGPATANLAPGEAREAADKAAGGLVDKAVATDAAPAGPRRSLRSMATAKSAEAADATKKAQEARLAAVRANKEAVGSTKALRRAEVAKAKAETQLRQAERRLADEDDEAALEPARQAKDTASAALAAAQAQLDAVNADVQAKQELAARLREEVKTAEAAKTNAQEEASEAQRKLSPVTVFISRKTQRLYVRQAREPLFDVPVTIADPDSPLGTYVFNALAYANAETELRWSVVSMYPNAAAPAGDGKRQGANRQAAAAVADVAGAKLALERIAIPKEAVDRISEVVSPGSSLIISDEAMSRETGKATDIIVVMSHEPQGGLKIRRPQSDRYRFDRYRFRPYDRAPPSWNGPSSWW